LPIPSLTSIGGEGVNTGVTPNGAFDSKKTEPGKRDDGLNVGVGGNGDDPAKEEEGATKSLGRRAEVGVNFSVRLNVGESVNDAVEEKAGERMNGFAETNEPLSGKGSVGVNTDVTVKDPDEPAPVVKSKGELGADEADDEKASDAPTRSVGAAFAESGATPLGDAARETSTGWLGTNACDGVPTGD
jgi:hypothetical protein